MIYYLKTENEESLWLALETVGLATKEYDPDDELNRMPTDLSDEDTWAPSGSFEWKFKGEALDIIGSIYTKTGNMLTSGEGVEYQELAAVDGFHANMIADAGIEGLPVVDAPATPYRKWAGM